MKKLTIAIVLGIVMILAFGSATLADDPITVDIVVLGEDPTVTVLADGSGAIVYINGVDIQQPVVYSYSTENPYDDTVLKSSLELMSDAIDITSDGLSKVILVIQEHTSNITGLLNQIYHNNEASVDRDNELVVRGQNQDAVIALLDGRLVDLRDLIEANKQGTDENLLAMALDYRSAYLTANADIAELRSELQDVRSESNTKIVWTWGSLCAIGVLLGLWKLWAIRLEQTR